MYIYNSATYLLLSKTYYFMRLYSYLFKITEYYHPILKIYQRVVVVTLDSGVFQNPLQASFHTHAHLGVTIVYLGPSLHLV